MADTAPNPSAPPAAPAVPPVTRISVPANPAPAPAPPDPTPGGADPAAGVTVPPGYELRKVDRPTRPPQYLSVEHMAAVIRAGGSVLHHDRDDQGMPTGDSRLISRVEHLPGAAHLARGNPEAEARARESLQAQRAQIDAELAKLDKPADATGTPAPTGTPQPTPPPTPPAAAMPAPTGTPQPTPPPTPPAAAMPADARTTKGGPPDKK